MKEFKVIALSDTHNQLDKLISNDRIPDGDIIIHAGDATGRGSLTEVERFCKEYGSLPHKYKIFTPGNHDFLFETDEKAARKLCEDNGIICLIDESITIEGIKIHGSPITPWFCDWAFNRIRGDKDLMFCYQTGKTVMGKPIKPHWDLIPDDTNILVTHGPVYGILDELCYVNGDPKGIFVGCEELLERINVVKPDIHICGHIHCAYGEEHVDGISYYNVSICDEMYSTSNEVKSIVYVKD